MKVLRKFSIYAVFSIIEKSIPYLTLTILSLYLSKDDIGVLANIEIFLQLAFLLSLVNIDRSITLEYFKPHQNNTSFGQYHGSGLTLTIFFNIFVAITCILFKQYLSELIGISPNYMLLMALIPLGRCFYFLAQNMSLIKKKALQYGIVSIIFALSNSCCILYYIILEKNNIVGVVKGYFLGSIITLIVSLVLLNKFRLLRMSLDSKLFREIMIIALPLVPLRLMHIVLNGSDRLFISHYVSLEELGIYYIAYMIGSIVYLFNTLFAKTWTPYLFEFLNQNSEESHKNISRFSVLYIGFMFIIVLLVNIFGFLYFKYILPEEYQQGSRYIPIISSAYLVFSFYQLYSLILLYNKKVKIFTSIAALSISVNLIMNILLIPTIGVVGAAYSTLLSFIALSSICYLYARKYYKYQWI